MSSTKIVATLGPASLEPGVLEEMLQAGVSVVRINCSHGRVEDHARTVHHVRSVAERIGAPLAILADLQGPKIRVGTLEEGSLILETGSEVVFISGRETSPDPVVVPVAYPHLAADVDTGDRVLLSDGMLETIVLDVDRSEGRVRAQVVRGGVLKSRKGINLPGVAVTAKSPTEQDLHHLEVLMEAGVDYVALSFVLDAADVRRLRYAVAVCEGRSDAERALEHGVDYHTRVGIVSKLERPEAMENLAEILEVSDVVMVARGDLGVETGPEYVPVLQKRMIAAANAHAVPVITATEMLESMVKESRPTRAEASDVANAVFDGTDAVMLSAETAVGVDPANVVRTMRRICDQAEAAAQFLPADRSATGVMDASRAVARAVKRTVEDLSPDVVVVFTETGASARLVSSVRPGVPVLALSPSASTLRRCAMFQGVTLGAVVDAVVDAARMAETAVEAALSSGLASPGSTVVVVSGTPGQPGGTDRVQVAFVPPASAV